MQVISFLNDAITSIAKTSESSSEFEVSTQILTACRDLVDPTTWMHQAIHSINRGNPERLKKAETEYVRSLMLIAEVGQELDEL